MDAVKLQESVLTSKQFLSLIKPEQNNESKDSVSEKSSYSQASTSPKKSPLLQKKSFVTPKRKFKPGLVIILQSFMERPYALGPRVT